MSTDTITKAAFNAAVDEQRLIVQPLLRTLEQNIAALDLGATHAVVTGAAALHAALADALAAADALGATEMHTEGGGTGKGDGE